MTLTADELADKKVFVLTVTDGLTDAARNGTDKTSHEAWLKSELKKTTDWHNLSAEDLAKKLDSAAVDEMTKQADNTSTAALKIDFTQEFKITQSMTAIVAGYDGNGDAKDNNTIIPKYVSENIDKKFLEYANMSQEDFDRIFSSTSSDNEQTYAQVYAIDNKKISERVINYAKIKDAQSNIDALIKAAEAEAEAKAEAAILEQNKIEISSHDQENLVEYVQYNDDQLDQNQQLQLQSKAQDLAKNEGFQDADPFAYPQNPELNKNSIIPEVDESEKVDSQIISDDDTLMQDTKDVAELKKICQAYLAHLNSDTKEQTSTNKKIGYMNALIAMLQDKNDTNDTSRLEKFRLYVISERSPLSTIEARRPSQNSTWDHFKQWFRKILHTEATIYGKDVSASIQTTLKLKNAVRDVKTVQENKYDNVHKSTFAGDKN